MESMIFKVSAKTARLIGRENISDVDGAIIELVKNGYDADADCVLVKYIIPYNSIPKSLSLSEIELYFQEKNELIDKFYIINNGKYELKLDTTEIDELEQYIKSLSRIIVLDNGSGMTESILKNEWMKIGTDYKEKNIYSKVKNRIKTGAKGIGRFALDKLSLRTTIYTKSHKEDTYEWSIDWQQFESVELLNQVKATMNRNDKMFREVVREVLKEDFDMVSKYSWDTGTLIVLSPIRTFWSNKLFKKVNASIRNINPLGAIDKFDVFISNEYNHELDYIPSEMNIERENYDYLVKATYDGDSTISITYDRNEININNVKVCHQYSLTDVEEYDIEEFWSRDAFKRTRYRREDYNGIQKFVFSLREIVSDSELLDICKNVGPFSVQLYYIKNMKSTTEIIKNFQTKKRKKLLDVFSGIKLYRDNFKVRPYGDQGSLYDWINLGQRVQLSPAAASHRTGKWRISPNQIIGSVSISRLKNPKLMDNANREGMSMNREYDCFIEIIHGIISRFEYDRQYVLREFASWINTKKKAHEVKAQEIYEQISRKKYSSYTGREFSKKELEEAIISFGEEHKKNISTEQIMMVLSASGVIVQTFSHEIMRMATNFGSRGQHLKATIDMLLDYKDYSGDEDFNPYTQIQELNETDILLSKWVELIMDSIERVKFDVREIDLIEALNHIVSLWEPLLNRKYININIDIKSKSNRISILLSEVDLHLIINNFILNSAYYLEEADGIRNIVITLYRDADKIVLDMKNNGPLLDDKYRQNPDISLEAQETSKVNGTGLGLWIANNAIMRSDGELHVIPIDDGYLLRASWKG